MSVKQAALESLATASRPAMWPTGGFPPQPREPLHWPTRFDARLLENPQRGGDLSRPHC